MDTFWSAFFGTLLGAGAIAGAVSGFFAFIAKESFKAIVTRRLEYHKDALGISSKVSFSALYRCALTGRRMVVGDPWLKPSPDRIDSDKGYERENLQMTTWAANRAKGALEPERAAGFFLALQMARDGAAAESDTDDCEEVNRTGFAEGHSA